ncbi:lysophospholipid acyltransferase family protein [Limibaculum sp. M0105]|uniref:Lysophospholipid acyltransferase family protein n=1 Tax=Thermohalobaculum xanthum TaxID=2753746 RepID=A0A8J7M6H9_9RHOB|nr:lysophospholipid acyltransferase family protein [Thermohalobaculum xanthum]MBK0399085.1 lysophospholipid acyltransferase family protein [Thermohalobaculum xanthum]
MRRRRRDSALIRAGEWLVYALGRTFAALTRHVPLWPLEGAFGALCGLVVLAVPGFRRRVEQNLTLVRPALDAAARRRLTRAAAAQFGRLMVEYAHFPRFVSETEIRAEGLDQLAAIARSGRGAVLVTAHYGNWEAARVAAQRAGVECGIIYRAFNNRYIDRRAMIVIPRAGRPVLQKGASGMRAFLQHVEKGGVAMVLVDQRNSGAPLIPFLGQPAETVTIAAELARRTGAALIPTVARRNAAERRFDVSFEPEIPHAPPREMMAEVNDRIGAWIEADPAQWFWFHRRWKRRATMRREGDTRRGKRANGASGMPPADGA